MPFSGYLKQSREKLIGCFTNIIFKVFSDYSLVSSVNIFVYYSNFACNRHAVEPIGNNFSVTIVSFDSVLIVVLMIVL